MARVQSSSAALEAPKSAPPRGGRAALTEERETTAAPGRRCGRAAASSAWGAKRLTPSMAVAAPASKPSGGEGAKRPALLISTSTWPKRAVAAPPRASAAPGAVRSAWMASTEGGSPSGGAVRQETATS